MSAETCFLGISFIPLDANGQKFFGFSEFLASLALMVLAWTIADVRYRFRVRTAPIPLQGVTFSVVAAVGILTLLTDLWRAEQWLVPKGNILTPASWQALLGGLFLLTFLMWTWFAFIRPPIFGRRNAERFAQTLYRFILKGSPAELAVIADEITSSARALVRHATDRGELKNYGIEHEGKQQRRPPKVEAYANDLLLLIADKRLCRSIVESSPGTALAIFQEMRETKKYGIQVETFAKNIVNAALENRDSFIFHEAAGYDSGLIGYHKPLSQAMFSNYRMVETIGTLLDPDILGKSKWDDTQWEAYCRVVLMTFRDYVDKQFWQHSFALYRAKGYIEHAASDVYKLEGVTNVEWDDDVLSRLRVVVEFIKDAVAILDEKGVPDHLQLRLRERNGRAARENFYDYLAGMIFEVIFAASAVKSPRDQCWWIQHNSVWGKLFNFDHLNGAAGKAVKFKARRLLYNEIADMKRFANFKGARILGFCLNVMGLNMKQGDYDKDSRALHKAVLAWTKKNYVWLHGYNPRIAEACLVDGMTYDAEKLRLVKTYPVEGLRREESHVYLDLDSTPVELIKTDWREERIKSIKESLAFFSNKNKLEREKWVVARLLERIIPEFDEASLSEAEEPADVMYKSANFQVKEIMESDRRRGDEFKQALENAETAEEYGDLLEHYTPYDISFSEIVRKCHEYSKELLTKYGHKERKSMDLVCYFNFLDSHETPNDDIEVNSREFRSFSVVSNRYRAVIYVCDDAPDFIKKQVGIVYDITRHH